LEWETAEAEAAPSSDRQIAGPLPKGDLAQKPLPRQRQDDGLMCEPHESSPRSVRPRLNRYSARTGVTVDEMGVGMHIGLHLEHPQPCAAAVPSVTTWTKGGMADVGVDVDVNMAEETGHNTQASDRVPAPGSLSMSSQQHALRIPSGTGAWPDRQQEPAAKLSAAAVQPPLSAEHGVAPQRSSHDPPGAVLHQEARQLTAMPSIEHVDTANSSTLANMAAAAAGSLCSMAPTNNLTSLTAQIHPGSSGSPDKPAMYSMGSEHSHVMLRLLSQHAKRAPDVSSAATVEGGASSRSGAGCKPLSHAADQASSRLPGGGVKGLRTQENA